MTGSALSGFAAERGLDFDEAGRVRAATHALAAAGVRGERPVASGELAPGTTGQLFIFPAGERGGGFTAALIEVPETRAYAVTIACQRRKGPAGREPVKYPTEKWVEVQQESVLFEREFRLLVLEGQDPGWTLELFTPSLISWLTDRAPESLGFELNEGWLCVLQPGELTDPGAFGELCAAAAELARRLREEALEEEEDPDLLRFAKNTERMNEAIGRVEWKRPPADVAEAVAAYRAYASRRPTVFFAALVGGFVGLVIGAGVGYIFGILSSLGGAFVGASIGFALLREIRIERYRFGGGLTYSWVGINAFNQEHARSRGLERVKISRFHHDNRDLPVRGEADSVQVGAIPGTDLSGTFAMLADSPELRAHGANSMSAADGRPLSADALIVELPHAPDAAAVEALDLPEGYGAAGYGRSKVVVWRPIPGNMTRSLAGCDEFRETAGRAISTLV